MDTAEYGMHPSVPHPKRQTEGEREGGREGERNQPRAALGAIPLPSTKRYTTLLGLVFAIT